MKPLDKIRASKDKEINKDDPEVIDGCPLCKLYLKKDSSHSAGYYCFHPSGNEEEGDEPCTAEDRTDCLKLIENPRGDPLVYRYLIPA